MNLQPLFEMQQKLDDRIVKEHSLEGQDLLDKKILALQVELGELSNEQRSWKFWSKDQKPRKKVSTGDIIVQSDGYEIEEFKNPLLEEFVDCLHFILSIGLELEYEVNESIGQEKVGVITGLNHLFGSVFELGETPSVGNFLDVLNMFFALGNSIGFTRHQIYHAYMDKNNINHVRQDNAY